MLARDEETLLRRHLPSWSPILQGGCIVGQVDDRTSDQSHLAFLDPEVISNDVVPHERRYVYHYSFDGLGASGKLLDGSTLGSGLGLLFLVGCAVGLLRPLTPTAVTVYQVLHEPSC